jgi:putative ABC transport system permease protein
MSIFVGVAGGIALSRYFSSLFFGVSLPDHATYVEVALLMIGIALVACFLPTWCAIRANRIVALRYEWPP